MRRTPSGIVVFLCLASGSVVAQSPIGAEFRVNTTTIGGQTNPAVAGDGAGSFVVTWWQQGANGIFAQRYAANGAPIGGQFQVNTPGDAYDYFPAVAMKPSGEFVVVWSGSAGAEIDILGRRFSSTGAAIGGDFRVDTAAGQHARYPRVAYDTNGGFSVVWQQGPLPYAAYRRFDASGNALGGVADLADSIETADVAALPGGRFVVSWSLPSPGPQQVWAERLDSTGNSLGGAFRVDTYGSALSMPRVGADSAGNFTVAWYTPSGYFPLSRISGRRYDGAGNPLTGEFQVDIGGNGPISTFIGAGVAKDGSALVAWPKSLCFGCPVDIRARLFSAGEMRANTYTTGGHNSPDVAAVAPGRFVVVWSSVGQDGDMSGVYAQRVTAPLSGDANGDGVVDVSDVFYLINFLFAGGPPPGL